MKKQKAADKKAAKKAKRELKKQETAKKKLEAARKRELIAIDKRNIALFEEQKREDKRIMEVDAAHQREQDAYDRHVREKANAPDDEDPNSKSWLQRKHADEFSETENWLKEKKENLGNTPKGPSDDEEEDDVSRSTSPTISGDESFSEKEHVEVVDKT